VKETNYVTLGAEQVWVQMAPMSFDAATLELWGSLLNGGRLVVMPAPTPSLEEIGEVLRREQVTVVWLTAGLFHLMVDERLEDLRGVRQVLAGGDVLSVSHVRKVLEQLDGVQVINGYGPTENTTFTCCHRVSAGSPLERSVPIGRPIANTQVYVLDREMEPAPVGVAGELYIGGDGLAREYWRRPELTAEKFVPNPFAGKSQTSAGKSPIPNSQFQTNSNDSNQQFPNGLEFDAWDLEFPSSRGERLYRTGDVVRYLADGNLEFLGRLDQQVKIRGFRVEPGEIESVLSEHPGVSEAVVVARADGGSAKRLVAYVVPNKTTDHRPQTTDLEKEEGLGSWVLGLGSFSSELRRYVREKLPEYMLPSAFVVMDALPLTPNGKVDRRALPAPEYVRPDAEAVRPRSAVEEVLAKIWMEVLRLERVGVQDNFFELGGDSILSIQIVAKANQAGIRLTPQQMFQHQTIAELAAVAGTIQAMEAEQGVVTGEVPLTPIQQWFFEQELVDPHHFNQAVLLQVRPGTVTPAVVKRGVEQWLVQHDALRLRFVRGEQGWQQNNAGLDGTIPFGQVDVSGLPDPGAAIETVAEQVQASLNLSEGPLLRAVWFDLGLPQPSRLLIVIHHLAIDGVSWRILLEDLMTVYEQLSRGQTIELAPKTTSFKRWAERLSEYARSDALKDEVSYWLAEARNRGGQLPVDYSKGQSANTVASSRAVSVMLSEDETRALLQEAPEAYHTQINDVLLTALAQVFAEWTGQRWLLVDLEGHGREGLFDGVDVTRTVGWFTSLYPVRLDLESATDVGSALKTVKEQMRRIPRRGVGYGVLRYLSGDREVVEQLRAQPPAEVSFNYFGQFDQVLPENAPLGPAPESSGPVRSRRGQQQYVLEISGSVVGGRMQVVWVYSDQVHRRETIERLAQAYQEALRAIIAHCQSPDAGGYTPSDFPKMKFSQEELDDLMAELSASVGD
jgi:amino acid adenylation domain-containing protein/non-ribosomal peptide synthase protein (TIGR01720 family)